MSVLLLLRTWHLQMLSMSEWAAPLWNSHSNTLLLRIAKVWSPDSYKRNCKLSINESTPRPEYLYLSLESANKYAKNWKAPLRIQRRLWRKKLFQFEISLPSGCLCRSPGFGRRGRCGSACWRKGRRWGWRVRGCIGERRRWRCRICIFVCPKIAVAALRTSHPALVGGGTSCIISGVDGGWAGAQRHSLGKAAVVLKRSQQRIDVKVACTRIAPLHDAMAYHRRTRIVHDLSPSVTIKNTVHDYRVAITIIEYCAASV